MPTRQALTKARRIVVKIGSRALAGDPGVQRQLASEIARQSVDGRTFVLVSSGAIAIGVRRLGYGRKPKEVAKLQAAAAAGQSELMRVYDEAFSKHGVTTAQVLLTHTDLSDRERLNNARQALSELIDAGAVPIVNENDTVSTEEIRFGDNDQLASMVVPLVGADLLVLLTDVEGVLDAQGERIRVMDDSTSIGNWSSLNDAVGTGGIVAKIEAAWKACRSGAHAVIAPASRPGVLASLFAGADVGTLFVAHGSALRARKHWIAYTLRPRGVVLLDEGAVGALRAGRSSLLPIGVVGVRGQFNAGDAVSLVGPDGTEVGRGLARLGALDVARAARRKHNELEQVLGTSDVVVVHKDDLVVH